MSVEGKQGCDTLLAAQENPSDGLPEAAIAALSLSGREDGLVAVVVVDVIIRGHASIRSFASNKVAPSVNASCREQTATNSLHRSIFELMARKLGVERGVWYASIWALEIR